MQTARWISASSSRLHFRCLSRHLGVEVEDVLVRAQGGTSFGELSAEVCRVGILLGLDDIIQFLEQCIGVQIHGLHGILCRGIDTVEFALCFFKGTAGTFLSEVFLFSLAEVLAEDAFEESEA